MIQNEYIKISKLVDRIKEGDFQVFEELYLLSYKKIYFLALDLLKDELMAEDATQEIFIIILKSIHELKNSKLFLAWSKKITYNYCISKLSKLKNFEFENFEGSCYKIFNCFKDSDPLETYLWKENSCELMDLISSLSKIHSTVLYLKYFKELKISEIASILDISEGTVKSRLNNARKALYNIYVSNILNKKNIS